jgi:hypothetical protein
MKPVAIDLFCGKGGWTNALLEVGFEVYGFDIEPQPDYKGIFVQCDILALTADDLRQYGASFATCSSPCEQFSVHGMKHFHPNPKYPEMGIKLFNHARSLLGELDIPYVMENVRSSERFIGRAVNHCGPYYLWGNAVPAIFPREAYKVNKGTNRDWDPVTRIRSPKHLEQVSNRGVGKGMDMGESKHMRGMTQDQKREYRKQFAMMSAGSKSTQRQEFTAQAAMIPLPIARAVAELALNLVRVEA